MVVRCVTCEANYATEYPEDEPICQACLRARADAHTPPTVIVDPGDIPF